MATTDKKGNLKELNAGLSTNPVHKLPTYCPQFVHVLSTLCPQHVSHLSLGSRFIKLMGLGFTPPKPLILNPKP